ncbi:MAG TPA: nitroreductase family protein [Anaerolineales bacterium]|nr:nitroreductase family protein [Anaerolineales bacterium]
MTFSDLIARRYSVRAYRSNPVEAEKLNAILEAGRMAPTASNRQAFGIIVARPATNPEKFHQLYHREWLLQAPYLICICTLTAQSWANKESKSYADVDAALVVDHMVLQAAELGLGTCIIANFDPPTASELFSLPKGVEPVLMFTLGYPADQPKTKVRKPLAELVHEGHW